MKMKCISYTKIFLVHKVRSKHKIDDGVPYRDITSLPCVIRLATFQFVPPPNGRFTPGITFIHYIDTKYKKYRMTFENSH